MRRFGVISFCAVVLVSAVAASGQESPLGDVARKERNRQKAKPASTATKVLTNEDLPKRPADEEDVKPIDDANDDHSAHQNSREVSRPANGQSAEQWKAQILMQKRSIAAQQEQVDQFRKSIHFVEANRYVNGPQYNEQQRRRQIQLQQMEKQLEEQKKRLADAQESARRAGFGNSVYDPND
jgi:hypothetical protein